MTNNNMRQAIEAAKQEREAGAANGACVTCGAEMMIIAGGERICAHCPPDPAYAITVDPSITAGAAKGGITSLEGLTRYDIDSEGELRPVTYGNLCLYDDVRTLLATTAGEQAEPKYDVADALSKFVELAISEMFTGSQNKAIRSDMRNLAKGFNPAYWHVAAPAAPEQVQALKDEQIHHLWQQSYMDALKDAGVGIGNGDVAHMNHPIYFARAIERYLAAPSAAAPAAPEQPFDPLRLAVRQMASALANGEWADLLTTDHDAAALEAEIQRVLDASRAAEQAQNEVRNQALEEAARIVLDGSYWNGAPADVYATAVDRAAAIRGMKTATNEGEQA